MNSHLNAVLYRMCAEMPAHDVETEVRAKVVIIDRTYAAGLGRHSDGGIVPATRALVASRKWLDKDLRILNTMTDHQPSLDRIVQIATIHARVQKALGKVTRDGSGVRSFVSKYLHFHAPVVPIYDQYANAEMKGWYRWPPNPALIAKPPDVDETYWRHCVRHSFVVEEWRRLKIGPPTARAIDTYALGLWETS